MGPRALELPYTAVAQPSFRSAGYDALAGEDEERGQTVLANVASPRHGTIAEESQDPSTRWMAPAHDQRATLPGEPCPPSPPPWTRYAAGKPYASGVAASGLAGAVSTSGLAGAVS